MATLYFSDGTFTENVEPKDGRRFKLAEVQELVGGYVELITLTKGRIALIDEDGRSKQLPVNREATLLYRKAGYHGRQALVGNVLVCDFAQFD